MLIRKRFPLMNDADPGSTGGGAADAVVAPPADPAAIQADPDPNASLLNKPDEMAWLPEKYRVAGADGKIDLHASGRKMSDGLAAAVKKIGSGDVAPATPADYKFQPPEQFKDAKFDDNLSGAFRDKCHKLGISGAQYQGIMESYLELVPGVLDSVLKLSTSEAKAALQQVWPSQAEYDAGLADAQRLIDSMPPALGAQVWERFGRDPLAFQAFAHIGKEMREDRAPSHSTGGGSNQNAEQLMASEAYRNPKHSDHARVSAEVNAMFQKQHGNAAAVQ